jgi:sortase (surface protein transpeptidase)
MFRRTALVIMITLWMAMAAVPRPAACAVAAEEEGPRLLAVLPAQGELAGRDAVVAMSFDRPMDTESLKSACRFEPPVDFRVSGESECLMVPVSLLEGGREYFFYLEPGIASDMQGRTCKEGMVLAFSTRDDHMVMEVPAMSFYGEVVEGATPEGVAALTGFGVGHYPGAGRPGSGNFVLMAHSSGQIDFPFNALNGLREGDEFMIEYGGRSYAYLLEDGLVIRDDELWILDPTPFAVMTIFICCAEDGKPSPTFHPPYRYVVRADLAGTGPGI